MPGVLIQRRCRKLWPGGPRHACPKAGARGVLQSKKKIRFVGSGSVCQKLQLPSVMV